MDLDGPLGISSHGVVGSNPGKRLFFWLDLFCSAVTEFMGLWSGHEHLVFSQTYVAIQLISSDELVWMPISMMKETVVC